MMSKVLLVFRHAALYRAPIYKKIDQEFDSSFFFSKNPIADLKMMDVSLLSKVHLTLKELILPFGFYYLRGMLSISFKNSENIIFAGDVRDVSSWLLLIKCKLLKKKSYLWTHAWYGKEGFILKLIKKAYYKLADNVLLYGSYARSLMIENGISPNKLHVIYNSLDYDLNISLRDKLIKNDLYHNVFKYKAPVLLFVGRLTAVKKLNLLIEAQKKLIDSGFICNVIFIGDGDEKDLLKKNVHDNILEPYVHFFGSCYDNNLLSELIYNADVCVSPGNVGLTAIHSLSFGTPVITHDRFELQMPEFEAIEKDITGDYFRYNSSESLADTIKQWLLLHPMKSEELIKRCYSVIDEKYNPCYQVSLLNKCFLRNEI